MNGQTDLFSFRSLEPPACKHCGSNWLIKDGRYNHTRKQRYACKRCGCRFVFNQSDLEKMRHKSSVIAFCVELYSRSGVSLRTLASYLQEHFEIKISHEAVRNWIEKAAEHDVIPDFSGFVIRHWMADETCIKINGEQYWLWVVFSPEYKLVLAWHISETRTEQDAVWLFQKALKTTKQKPEKLTTDQLDQYPLALQKVLGRVNVHHEIVEELGKNNGVERFFREVKRRIKWFSTFRAKHSAWAFFHMYFYCHHYLKQHKTLKQTPLPKQTMQAVLKRPLTTPQT